MPIAVHGPALPSLFRSYFDLNRPDHMLEASHMAHTFAQMLACSNIVTGGVLEQFQSLKVAFLEAGAGWVPYWMHRMDEYNEVAPERWAHISAKPSEYIKGGRVFFSCEPGDEFIPFFVDHVGEDAMIFASDYLHFDALFVGEPTTGIRTPGPSPPCSGERTCRIRPSARCCSTTACAFTAWRRPLLVAVAPRWRGPSRRSRGGTSCRGRSRRDD